MNWKISKNAKFYKVKRDTRWDVYPQEQPVLVGRKDDVGVWLPNGKGGWFLPPGSYYLVEEITEEQAEALIPLTLETIAAKAQA